MANLLDDPRIDWAQLEQFGFDRDGFLAAAQGVASGALNKESSLIDQSIEPVNEVVDVDWGEGSREARALGVAALRAGQVAVVVLNGGMATRFGGVVKGTVEVYDGLSFIALKAQDLARASAHFEQTVPFVLMNSFATHQKTMDHVQSHERFGLGDDQVFAFTQTISLRLTPEGGLFEDAKGALSYYAPGHGDFFPCIRASGVLGELRARGVEVILFSNVDNLGATIDPVIVGHHLLAKAGMSVEVTAKRRTASGAWDKGGAPALVGGRPQLVEGFRLPPDLPPTFLPDFSTNNFVFSAATIDREIRLPRHVVEKTVDGKPAIQMESIACEVSEVDNEQGERLVSMQVLRVPRDGAHGRFYPIKEREDLEASRSLLRQRLEQGWSLRDS